MDNAEESDIKYPEEHDDLDVLPESIGNDQAVMREEEEKGSCALLEQVRTYHYTLIIFSCINS